tara:strand:- start:411 stop:911 length:501 start_codon:yes stop_codon:yes gene_type:complete
MIRQITPQDLASVLAINNEAVPAVNALTASELSDIVNISEKAWVVDEGDKIVGVLIVLGPRESYGSANYTWLNSQFTNFCYVDRIIIATSGKRNGYGKALYLALEEHAVSTGVEMLLCEVNVEPENPQSMAFHESLGWVPFQDREHGPGKIVRYFKKLITSDVETT